MTRKDFELIAATIKLGCPERNADVHDMAHRFAEALKSTNKQFNRDRFLRACGVSP